MSCSPTRHLLLWINRRSQICFTCYIQALPKFCSNWPFLANQGHVQLSLWVIITWLEAQQPPLLIQTVILGFQGTVWINTLNSFLLVYIRVGVGLCKHVMLRTPWSWQCDRYNKTGNTLNLCGKFLCFVKGGLVVTASICLSPWRAIMKYSSTTITEEPLELRGENECLP